MSGTISYQPYAQGSAAGTFGLTTEGFIQGMSYDDPIFPYSRVSGVLASSESLPMWGGVGIYEDLPSSAAGVSAPAANLGNVVGRATVLTAYAAGKLAGFSVFDSNYAAVATPQSPVPLIAINGQVNYFRLGSKRRIAVQISATLAAALAGGLTDAQVAWDFTNQQLTTYSTGTALQVRVLDINLGNSMTVSYSSGSGAATWVRNGNAAIIELV